MGAPIAALPENRFGARLQDHVPTDLRRSLSADRSSLRPSSGVLFFSKPLSVDLLSEMREPLLFTAVLFRRGDNDMGLASFRNWREKKPFNQKKGQNSSVSTIYRIFSGNATGYVFRNKKQNL